MLLAVGRTRHDEISVLLLDDDVADLAPRELPAGSIDPHDLGLDLNLDAVGHGDRLLADTAHQTYATTSPPTPSWRAWWPVMTPLDVVMITVPMPPSTFGSSWVCA